MIVETMHLFNIELEERRGDERSELTLRGRYMLQDRREFECSTIDISPTGVAIRGIERGQIGESVVAYFRQIGRIEGIIARHFGECFAVKMQAPPLRREQLAGRIGRLTTLRPLGSPDNREIERMVPYEEATTLRTLDGREYLATLLDVSPYGAALNISEAPPLDAQVIVGSSLARVMRHFPGGVAVAFNR
jgi:hypothetical protein